MRKSSFYELEIFLILEDFGPSARRKLSSSSSQSIIKRPPSSLNALSTDGVRANFSTLKILPSHRQFQFLFFLSLSSCFYLFLSLFFFLSLSLPLSLCFFLTFLSLLPFSSFSRETTIHSLFTSSNCHSDTR